jgi:hypothetical protein
LAYAFASFYVLTIPITGAFFAKRNWLMGKRYGFITPGDMFAYYYNNEAVRWLTVVTAFLYSMFLLRPAAHRRGQIVLLGGGSSPDLWPDLHGLHRLVLRGHRRPARLHLGGRAAVCPAGGRHHPAGLFRHHLQKIGGWTAFTQNQGMEDAIHQGARD